MSNVKHIFSWYYMFNKYLGLETECFWGGYWHAYFELDVRWTKKCDHAGFHFSLNVYKFNFNFNIYDNRHWNYKADRFYYEGENE